MDDIKKNYYAVIPANVRYDKAIPPAAKLLYAEVTALCNQSGTCWAENSYFAELYGVGIRTVQSWINALVDNGYLYRDIQYADDGKTVINRCLSIASENTTLMKNFTGGHENFSTTPMKKSAHRILNTNTTINNNILPPISPTEEKVPKEQIRAKYRGMVIGSDFSEEVEKAVLDWLLYKCYKYQEIGLKSLLKVVKENVFQYGDKAVIGVIEQSMSNSYQGIVWDRLARQPKTMSTGVNIDMMQDMYSRYKAEEDEE